MFRDSTSFEEAGVALRGKILPEAEEGKAELSYERYKALHDGMSFLINESDYHSALALARTGEMSKDTQNDMRSKAKRIADVAGINLDSLGSDDIDLYRLFGVLMKDRGPKEAAHHHDQMSDQRLLVETLRMLQEGDAARAIENAIPH